MDKPKLSEEEKKRRNRERCAKWYQENREKVLEKQKSYYEAHKEQMAECMGKYYQANKEKILEYHKKYNAEHKDEIAGRRAEYWAKYRKTKMGRAGYLAYNYDRNDEKYKRGKCTITPIWIIYNIFPMPCHYCGATGWEIMGCDRVDNTLPHTPDNVVPCCRECNLKRQGKSYEEFKKEMEGI